MEADPGLNDSMLRLLGENAKRCPEKYKRVCFMLDAMSIKKHVSFDPSKQQTIGCVNLGYGPDDDSLLEIGILLDKIAIQDFSTGSCSAQPT